MRKFFFFVFWVVSLIVNADNYVIVNGIHYRILPEYKSASVVKNKYYEGDIVIESVVEYDGKYYKVTSIEDEAFSGCKITSVRMPNSIVYIGKKAFYQCKLTSAIIPDGVKKIGDGAFKECYYLQTISIPNSVIIIGRYAFGSCPLISSVDIPDNVVSIDDYAFCGCSLRDVTIGRGVLKIGDGAFEGCDKIEKFIISKDVLSIGKNVLNRTHNVTIISQIEDLELVTMGKSEDTHDRIFGKGTTIYVPKGTKGKYIKTTGWRDYKNIYEYEENGPTDGIKNVIQEKERYTIYCQDGLIHIDGLNDNTNISIYTISGEIINSKRVSGKQVVIDSKLKRGEFAIVKIGEESFKVVID